MQTFAERDFQLKLFVDPIATGIFTEVPSSPRLDIVPGKPVTWKAILPTGLRLHDPFRLCLKAEDRWGNPAPMAAARCGSRPSLPISGLPESVDVRERQPDLRHRRIDRRADRGPDDFGDRRRRRLLAVSNPMRIVESAALLPYWGDLHGQSEETIGTASALHYFHFARDRAFLDLVGHQGNDFQITRGVLRQLNELTARLTTPAASSRFPATNGRAIPGSAATATSISPKRTTRSTAPRMRSSPIRRTSTPIAPRRAELFRRLQGYDAVVNAHVGGRYADVRIAHDGRIERSMEIHSAWGTFEWLLYDALDMGYRVGIVCNSDDHKGRPGASYPGASTFGAYGGLTCLLAARADPGGGDRLPAPAASLRHHRQPHGARCARPVRAPGGAVRRGPGTGPDLIADGARGDDGRHSAQRRAPR